MDATSSVLDGPRGRRLCLEVVRDAVWRADPGDRRLWWGARARDRAELAQDLACAVARIDMQALSEVADPRALVPALAESVARAYYWEEPDDVDLALQDVQLAAPLLPVAEAVLTSPASSWWTDPAAVGDQWHVRWRPRSARRGAGTAESASRLLDTWRRHASEEEQRARRSRPADPTAMVSGCWWSTPALSGLLATTALLPGTAGVPVGLVLQEDPDGDDEAEVRAAHVTGAPRIYEVTGPDAWVELNATFPMPVTHSRRHDWYRVTGWTGDWMMPDWRAAAEHWDGVHLTVAGYLSTAGRSLPVPVGAGTRTLLAGWDPGSTWWLSDAARLGAPVTWRRRGEEALGWTPTA